MATEEQSASHALRTGRTALASGDWERAREAFRAALALEETAQAWEGLGWAAWWLADEEETFRARERAYRLSRGAGDAAAAGRVATWIAADFLEFRGEPATGRGWLERAHRLLDGVPESADHGWLALTDADFALNVDRDLKTVLTCARQGSDLGRRLGVPDLEAVGLGLEGLALVGQGFVDDGMRRLDEASAVADGEEMQLPIASGWALCCVLSACDGIGDFPRARQGCEAIRRFADRWGGRQLVGVCRTSYGRILATSGDWGAAESELLHAVEDMESARPGMASHGLARLGELRARQGRVDEARELLGRAGTAGLVGLGELALDEGDALGAAETAERVLRRLPEASLLHRVPALELLTRARAQLGQPGAAADACAQVARAAEAFGTPYVSGRANLIAATVAAAEEDHEGARRACEDAIDCFAEASAPYDAALARLELAGALLALGRHEQAERECREAHDAFAGLGAQRDLARAAGLLEQAAIGARADHGSLGDLTQREVEIVRLVAQGMSDAEIAEKLVLSPHTVHRHVANIRAKLRLGSRSAAVAWAAREGLL
jgi:DNA-binding CsgD family transcriptional regulator